MDGEKTTEQPLRQEHRAIRSRTLAFAPGGVKLDETVHRALHVIRAAYGRGFDVAAGFGTARSA